MQHKENTMKTNTLKAKLAAGGTVIGTMCSGLKPTTVLAQMAAAAGFDLAMITMEHSSYSLQDVQDFSQMARAVGIVPLVRIPDLTYQWVANVLDVGAMGLMAPRMQDRRQAQELVSYVRFPPRGLRGWGGEGRTEFGLAGGPMVDVIKRLDSETLVIAQIEQVSAVDDIDAIAAVDGIDVCLIGPMDMSIALGKPGDTSAPAYIDAVQRVVDACKRHGKTAAAHLTSVDELAFWRQRGMRFLMSSSDTRMVTGGWSALAQDLRRLG
jgi:2-keto-3-deoxy-L-rhamnonate aldolase RhmA